MEKFSPNCTFPTTSNVYVDGPNLRSTTGIAWSCASIVILSTWSVLCLPVPPDVRPNSMTEYIRKELFLLKRKLFWMAMMLIYPEYLLSISVTNAFSCRVNHSRLQELAATDKVQWTLKHSMLADMGGIAIRFSEAPRLKCSTCGQSLSATTSNGNCSAETTNGEEQPGNHECPSMQPCKRGIEFEHTPSSSCSDISRSRLQTLGKEDRDKAHRTLEEFRDQQKRHLSGMGTVHWRLWERHAALAASSAACTTRLWYHSQNAGPFQGNIWILDSRQLIVAREYGIIPSLPSVDDGEIGDKCKSDGLVTLLSILQVSWLAIQLIARRVDGVPPTPLEISTLAFSACAFVLYLVEWSKPKGVGVPFYANTDACVTPESLQAIFEAAPDVFLHPVVFLQTRYYYMPMCSAHQVVGGRYKTKHRNTMMSLTFILTTLLFGGIHLLAWNLDFPTQVESLLWKIAALSATLAPTLSGLLGLGESIFQGTMGARRLPLFCIALLCLIFLVARLYLVVESVRSILSLPPGAFVATWASNIPHFT